MAEVKINGLTQMFSGVPALRGLDLEIGPGVTALLGPEGSGKTTLARTLATVIRPSDGALSILGLDPADQEQRRAIRRRLGYLPQTCGYHPGLTVRAFVEYFALLKEVPAGEVERAAARAIRRAGLEGSEGSKVRSLPEDALRLAGLAQAVVNDPDLLLLDDPFPGLAPGQRAVVSDVVREFGSRGVVVLATRSAEEAADACGSVVALSDGAVGWRGDARGLARTGGNPFRVGP